MLSNYSRGRPRSSKKVYERELRLELQPSRGVKFKRSDTLHVDFHPISEVDTKFEVLATQTQGIRV